MTVWRWLFGQREPSQAVASGPNWDEIVAAVARFKGWPPAPDSVMARLKAAVAAAVDPEGKIRAAEVILRGWHGAPQRAGEDDIWWFA